VNIDMSRAGPDQLNLIVFGLASATLVLDNPDIQLSLRRFNLGLMKKGYCQWGRNHCYDFADNLFED
jgi:hypothetical protein